MLRGQAITATLETGSTPFAVVVNSVTNKIYVASSSGNTVTVIDGATNATTSVAVGTSPDAIDVNMVTNKVYVANAGSNTVTVIDGATNATSTISLLGQPTVITVNPVTNKVYLSEDTFDGSYIFGCVTVIDGATNTATNIQLGANPGPMALDPVANKIYFLNDNSTSETPVTRVDGVTYASTLMGPSITTKTWDAVAIAVNTVTNKIYVPFINGGDIAVIDGAKNTYSIVGSGFEYGAIALNTVTNKAYVVDDDGNGVVAVIDGATEAVANVPTGNNPTGIALDPVTNVIYVANFNPAGSVTVIDGASNETSTIATGTNTFAVAVNPVTNKVYVLSNDAAGTVSVLDGLPAKVAPAIASAPQSQTVNLGSSVAFNATARARPSPSYQWSFNGTPLSDGNGVSGSSTQTLLLSGVTSAEAGTYACTATNGSGSATSASAALAVVSSPDPGRITNLSVRADVESGGFAIGPSNLTAGFVIGGKGSKTILLRGVGPTLGTLGVQGTLPNLVLSLFDAASNPNLITSDMGWQSPPTAPTGPWSGKAAPVDATAADFAQVGAFDLTPNSADCAVRVSLPAGAYTSQIAGTGVADGPVDGGIALAELYDEDSGSTGTQLVNISATAFTSFGVDDLIAGFVISGSTSQTLLVRASGPALAATFFVPYTLPDPTLQIYDSNQNLVASNSGWGGNPQITSTAASVGAFAWTDPKSADSALLISLPPGNYTAEVSSLSGNGGQALVEVYVVP
jgi:YVTN family beta-propeller protein